MKRLGTRRYSPIGLDVNSREVRAVQFAGSGETREVTAVARFECEGGLGDIKSERLLQIEDILFRQGFVGTRCVCAVPRESLLSAVLPLPSRESGAPVTQLARLELARTFNEEASCIESTSWDLPKPARAPDGVTVLATGCRQEDALGLVETLDAIGLDLVALDVRALALARSALPVLGDTTGKIAGILELGWERSEIVVVHDGTVVYEQSIADAALQTVYDAVLDACNADAEIAGHVLRTLDLDCSSESTGALPVLWETAESAAEELLEVAAAAADRSMSYAQSRYPHADITTFGFAGSGACLKGAESRLATRVNWPLRTLTPSALGTLDAHVDAAAMDPALAAAAGLALFNEATS